MAGQTFLTALAIDDLVAMRKAFAVSVDAAFASGKRGHPPRPGGLIAVFAGASANSVVGETRLGNPSDLAIILFVIRRIACDPLFDFFAGIENGFKISTGVHPFSWTGDCETFRR